MERRTIIILPFLYPCLSTRTVQQSWVCPKAMSAVRHPRRWQSTTSYLERNETADPLQSDPGASYLNPPPFDYSRFTFQDKCSVTAIAGSGGHGCVSFLREKYIDEGPPNGGDGGSGGSVYVQAIDGLTSLHKLARRGIIRAGRGKNGQGKSRGGKRGDDVVIQVPVGTVIREMRRHDPVREEDNWLKAIRAKTEDEELINNVWSRRGRWVLYPGSQPSDLLVNALPVLPPPRRSSLAAMEPSAPIFLDLSKHMEQPMLLAAGAVGGLGNSHFVSRSSIRPKFATKGQSGMRLELAFELKLLADVGLVGHPNAGKSTLLRSLTNSRTRVGDWEFTTLSPNIGTVVIDDFKGWPLITSDKETLRTSFTIADIPGIVRDAHLDRGLGLSFLRHIERARILAFVIDLRDRDPVQTLNCLWNELGEYDRLHHTGVPTNLDQDLVTWTPFDNHTANSDIDGRVELDSIENASCNTNSLPPLKLTPVSTKPWFVIATKADLPETKESFLALREYLSHIENGITKHPSGHELGWRKRIFAVPVSAMKGERVSVIPNLVLDLLQED